MTNYSRGRSREYRTLDKLRKEGFDIVFRSAGSHSKIDCIGIRMDDKKIRLIQCKPKSMSNNKRRQLEDELFWLNDMFECEFKVI